MGDTTIQWATKVWNPFRGCHRVSPGCENCYAERTALRFSGKGQPYEGLVRMGKSGPVWTNRGKFVPDKLDEPLRWKQPKDGSRHRIFVNSMSDVFFEAFSFEEIAAVFGVMAACPQHDFLVLTKRPKRALEFFQWVAKREGQGREMFPDDYASWRIGQMLAVELRKYGVDGQRPATRASGWEDFDPRRIPWPLPNVWFGVSCEDQQRANERVPILLQCPAALRWVSAEPCLGSIDLSRWLGDGGRAAVYGPGGAWMVPGGQSRPDLAFDSVHRGTREHGDEVVASGTGGAELLSETERLSAGDVSRVRRQAAQGGRAQNRMDGSESPNDSKRPGDKSQKRQEIGQRSKEPGDGDPSGEHNPRDLRAWENPSQGKQSETHSGARNRDQADLQQQGDDSARNRHTGRTSLAQHSEHRVATDLETRVTWVVVGGESGPRARPCNVEWVRAIVQQCSEAAVSCFVKQLGSDPTGDGACSASRAGHGTETTDVYVIHDRQGGDPGEWPEDLRVREFPKVAA